MKLSAEDVCIVGIGQSEHFGFDLGKSPLRLQVEAFNAALEDSGLSRSEIDGFATAHGSPRGVDYEEFISAVGLDISYVDQAWSHGRWATGTVAHAALAVMSGMAETVAVCNTTTTAKGYQRYVKALGGSGAKEGLRDFGGGHGEWSVTGVDTPGAATSLVARRYMDRYGATTDDLARIGVGYRANASRNPMAILGGKPLTMDSYYDEPLIADPFRRCDYALTNEGSNVMIITSKERAKDLAKSAVTIAGAQSVRANRDNYVLFSRPGLGVGFAAEFPFVAERQRVYEMAGIAQSELDGLYIYDSFTSNLWMVLEQFGFCGEGEAPEWIRSNGLSPTSALPVNTNGGLMAEGHFSGYAHLIEMVRQLRGEAGERQIADAHALQWATPWGDSLLFTS
jgi:acetyl-CoA acetyltransferase